MPTWKRIFVVLVIAAAALLVRVRAVNRLPIDWDEPVYFQTAQYYAQAVEEGQWRKVLNYSYVNEHPAFAKFLLGLASIGTGSSDEIDLHWTEFDNWELPPEPRTRMRTMNAVWGAITAGVVGLVSPIAGIMLAIHTFAIKYSSQIYIEAFPALTSTICGLAFIKYNALLEKRQDLNLELRNREKRWLILSAIGLGLSAASKYIYCLVGIVVLGFSVFQVLSKKSESKKRISDFLLWGGTALAVFVLFDFYLWLDIGTRLFNSIAFHVRYAGGEAVRSAGYPFWQPLIWMAKSIPDHPYQAACSQPGVFLLAIDPIISGLALLGLPGLIKKRSFLAFWLIGAVLFLLLWPTKWPQYTVVALTPMVLSAAEGYFVIINFIKARLIRRR